MSSLIKILELRDADGPGGGPEKTILHGAALADISRFEVTVCYIRPHADHDHSIPERARELGVNYLEFRQRGKFDRQVWRDLKEFVRRERFHIIHSHDYKTDFYNLLLARSEGTIPLTTAHGWSGHLKRERWVYYPAGKLLLKYFPVVISVSSHIADTLMKHGVPRDRIHILPNGIDTDVFYRRENIDAKSECRWNVNEEEFVIGGIGRLEPLKRFDLLIDAFSHIHKKYPHTRLFIAGEGSQRERLNSSIQQYGLEKVCRLTGHCVNIIEFHQSLNLFVQSSDTEGTPNVVLEAMAMEVPIVATAAGGTSDILTNETEGLIVPVNDRSRLISAIEECLLNPDAARSRARAARQKVEQELNFENRVRKVERIYESLCELNEPVVR